MPIREGGTPTFPRMVRTAREDDIDTLLAMGRAMHEESPRYAGKVFVEAKARGLIGRLLRTGGVFVAELGGLTIGMAGTYCVEHIFGFEKFAGDFVLYVLPEYRGSSAAKRLVRAIEAWAKEQGATEVLLGISTGVETERTAKLYEHLGYRESGRSLIKHV